MINTNYSKVASIESAMESRKDSVTDFEAFRYISAVRLGDFHTEMNMIIKDYQRLMPSESSKDKLTLSYFAQRIAVNHLVSNKPSFIKKVGKSVSCLF